MTYTVAINGYGRIGRCVVRALYESDRFSQMLNLAAVNEIACTETIFHLTRHDSTHGRFPLPVEKAGQGMRIGKHVIHLFQGMWCWTAPGFTMTGKLPNFTCCPGQKR